LPPATSRCPPLLARRSTLPHQGIFLTYPDQRRCTEHNRPNCWPAPRFGSRTNLLLTLTWHEPTDTEWRRKAQLHRPGFCDRNEAPRLQVTRLTGENRSPESSLRKGELLSQPPEPQWLFYPGVDQHAARPLGAHLHRPSVPKDASELSSPLLPGATPQLPFPPSANSGNWLQPLSHMTPSVHYSRKGPLSGSLLPPF